MATVIQRLSSGLRINSAKDDAAGQAISERMTSQVRGQEVAVRNANDAISLVQTAEGAIHEMSNILQRGRELAVQAANGTNSRSDRAALQAEWDQLSMEFDRISQATNFNGKNLLDGSFCGELFQVGANTGQTIGISVPALRKNELGYYMSASYSYYYPAAPNPLEAGNTSTGYMATPTGINFNLFDSTFMPARTMQIEGATINIAAGASAGAVASQINALDVGVNAVAATSPGFLIKNVAGTTQITLRLVAGEDYSKAETVSFPWDGSDELARNAMEVINRVSNRTGVVAEDLLSFSRTSYAAVFRLTTQAGETLHVLNDSDPSVEMRILSTDWNEESVGDASFTGPLFGGMGSGVFGVDDLFCYGRITLESQKPISYIPDGYTTIVGDQYGFFNTDPGSVQLALDKVSFKTGTAASRSLKVFDGALQQLSETRAELGAIQSRLENTISNLQTSTENLSASRSRIRDADYAAETAALTRQQVLQQAGTAMLSQANQIPQQVLALLK